MIKRNDARHRVSEYRIDFQAHSSHWIPQFPSIHSLLTWEVLFKKITFTFLTSSSSSWCCCSWMDTNGGCSYSIFLFSFLFFHSFLLFLFRWIAWLFTFFFFFFGIYIVDIHSWISKNWERENDDDDDDGKELPFPRREDLILANDLNTITWAYNKKKFTILHSCDFLLSLLFSISISAIVGVWMYTFLV